MEKTKIIDIPDGCKQIQVTETEIKFLPEKEIEPKMPPVMINKDLKFTSLIIPGMAYHFIENSVFEAIQDKIIQDYKDKYKIDNIVEQINKIDSGFKKQKINVIHEITGNKTIAFIRNSDVKFMTIPKDEYDLIIPNICYFIHEFKSPYKYVYEDNKNYQNYNCIKVHDYSLFDSYFCYFLGYS